MRFPRSAPLFVASITCVLLAGCAASEADERSLIKRHNVDACPHKSHVAEQLSAPIKDQKPASKSDIDSTFSPSDSFTINESGCDYVLDGETEISIRKITGRSKSDDLFTALETEARYHAMDSEFRHIDDLGEDAYVLSRGVVALTDTAVISVDIRSAEEEKGGVDRLERPDLNSLEIGSIRLLERLRLTPRQDVNCGLVAESLQPVIGETREGTNRVDGPAPEDAGSCKLTLVDDRSVYIDVWRVDKWQPLVDEGLASQETYAHVLVGEYEAFRTRYSLYVDAKHPVRITIRNWTGDESLVSEVQNRLARLALV